MKESLRQAYNSFYSQRESKSLSPSTGRVHKQRQSFGPTVCLINKNGESQGQATNDKMYILMLVLEIQRLNHIVGSLINSTKNLRPLGQENEIDFLKKQVLTLKSQLSSRQQQTNQQTQKLKRTNYSNFNKLSQFQTQIKLNIRRIAQLEGTNNSLHQKIRQLEEQANRARAQASRANMNNLLSSQASLQKSMIRQKSVAQMQLWKQKLTKYENMLNQQKQFIISQKLTIDRLQNSELQVRQRYEYDNSMLKKNIQDLTEKCQKMQRQMANKLQSSSAEVARQMSSRQRQVQHLRQKLAQSSRQNQQLRSNLDNISKNKNETLDQMRALINQLRQSLEQLNEDYHQLTEKHQNCKNEIGHYKKQNQVLKNQISNLNKNYSNQLNNLQQEISNRQNQVRRLNKNAKKLQMEGKLQKSYSQANLRSTATNSLKNSRTDLSGIIKDVIDLQDSNSRVIRLIQSSKSRSQVIQHRQYSLSHYGL